MERAKKKKSSIRDSIIYEWEGSKAAVYSGQSARSPLDVTRNDTLDHREPAEFPPGQQCDAGQGTFAVNTTSDHAPAARSEEKKKKARLNPEALSDSRLSLLL